MPFLAFSRMNGFVECEMIFFVVFFVLSTSTGMHSNTVTSPQIRILDVATKASETRVIPRRIEYADIFHPSFQLQNNYERTGPLKSYVIYDEYPLRIFKEWKANPPTEFPSAPQSYLEFRRQQNVELPPNYRFQNGQQIKQLPPPSPTLAYRSVYSNIIKVFDNSLEDFDQNRFQSERYVKPLEEGVWKSQNPIEYEPVHLRDVPRRQMYHNLKLPENFPKVFLPNEKFHFPSFDRIPQSPPFYPQGTKSTQHYNTYTVNYNKETPRYPDEVEVLSEVALKQKNQKKAFLCSFVRVNERQFPEKVGPCSRSTEDLPVISPEYPDYSSFSNDKIPVEHRREYFQVKRIKRNELNESKEGRQKRDAGFGYGYGGWGSPFGYENGYDGYFSNNYPGRASYRNNYSSGYYNGRNANQGFRNNYRGSRYDDYDDDYQNNDDSNSRGLTSYLTNGGRRYKNRKNNNEDEEDDEDDNNSNNREDDSEEEMERMNSNRRDTNDRRNNDDSKDRRRNNNNNNNNNNSNNNNNNYNDEDDYRDNRRNNNRNNNSRRYNNNNNNNNNGNNNNSNRRYNDRYDNNNNNNNRNRYYGNSNGYNSNSNGYGSSYGNYGSNYGGGYGNGGYGSGYGSNGGYGYGGYGNGFGSF